MSTDNQAEAEKEVARAKRKPQIKRVRGGIPVHSGVSAGQEMHMAAGTQQAMKRTF